MNEYNRSSRESYKKRIKRRKINRLKRKMKVAFLKTLLVGLIGTGTVAAADVVVKRLDTNIYYDNSLKIEDGDISEICSELSDAMSLSIGMDEADDLLLFKAIMDNKNLSDEQKSFFYEYSDLIMDNPYLNREQVYDDFLKLNISYCERPGNLDESVEGTYNHFIKRISVYEDDINYDVLRHEGIHAIFSNNNTDDLPTFFIEGMTELLSNEYFSSDPFYEYNHYPYAIASVKMLCESVGSDVVLESFTKGDINLIINKLGETIGRDNATTAIDILSNTFDYNQGNDVLKYSSESIKTNYDLLESCISDRDISSTDKIISRSNFNYNRELVNCCYSGNCNESFKSFTNVYGVEKCVYFSSKLKSEFSDSDIVSYSSRPFVYTR